MIKTISRTNYLGLKNSKKTKWIFKIVDIVIELKKTTQVML